MAKKGNLGLEVDINLGKGAKRTAEALKDAKSDAQKVADTLEAGENKREAKRKERAARRAKEADDEANQATIVRNMIAEGHKDAERAAKAKKDADREAARIKREQLAEEKKAHVSGPYQRREALARRLADPNISPEERQDIEEIRLPQTQYQVMRAQRQRLRSGAGTMVERLQTLLSQSRINLGPVSPMVEDVARVAGIPTIGPGAALLGAGAGALGAFIGALKVGTERANEFGEAMRQSGGTPSEVAGLERYGFSGGAGAAAASGFRSRISQPGFAQMFAARYGIYAPPEPFGSTDNAQYLQKATKVLEGMTDKEERLRLARVLEMESTLRYLDASDGVKRLMDEEAKLAEKIGSGDASKSANDLSLSFETMQKSFKDLAAVSMSDPMQVATAGAQGLTKMFQGINNLRDLTWRDIGIPIGPTGAELKKQDEEKSRKANTDALDKNRKAVEESTKVQLAQGEYGGGPLTRGAVAEGNRGFFLSRNQEDRALSRGMPGF